MLDGDACARCRLLGCRIRIEHIGLSDFVAMAEGDPAQRGQAGSKREVRLLLSVVAGSAGQCAWIGRAACRQLNRHSEQTRVLGGGEPFALGARRAGNQVAQDLLRLLVGILLGDGTKGRQVRCAPIRLQGIAPVGLVGQAGGQQDGLAGLCNLPLRVIEAT